MRMGMDVPLAAKLQRAREVIALAGLQGKEDAHVGGRLPGGIMVRGLSGGEKRRLSLCCGIVEAPEVLFCDEPTSGERRVIGLTGDLCRMDPTDAFWYTLHIYNRQGWTALRRSRSPRYSTASRRAVA